MALNAKNVENLWQPFGYFGIGAAASFIGAGVTGGVNSLLTLQGEGFWTGFIGKANFISTGFSFGFVSGTSGGFSSGFILGFSNSVMDDNNLKESLNKGVNNGFIGAISGGIIGGISGAVDAKNYNLNLLTGAGHQSIVIRLDKDGTTYIITGKTYDNVKSQSTLDFYKTDVSQDIKGMTKGDNQIKIKMPLKLNKVTAIQGPDKALVSNLLRNKNYISFTYVNEPNYIIIQGWRYYSNPIKSISDLFHFRKNF